MASVYIPKGVQKIPVSDLVSDEIKVLLVGYGFAVSAG